MRAGVIVPVVLLTAWVAGCVNYDERIELNADGSGIVRMHLAVSEQVLQQPRGRRVGGESRLLPMPREEMIREIEEEGLKVRSLRVSASKGLRHFYVIVEFKSLEDLAKSEFFGGRAVTLVRDGARWKFNQQIRVSEKTLTSRGGETPPPDAKTPEKKSKNADSILKKLEARFGKEHVRKMLSRYRLTFSVQLKDTGLIRTNGRNHRDVTAVWEFPLGDLVHREPTLTMQAEFARAEDREAPAHRETTP